MTHCIHETDADGRTLLGVLSGALYAGDGDGTNGPEALQDIALALRRLGVADADTHMGALELLAMETRDGTRRVAEGLHAIAEALGEVADAIRTIP